MTDPYVIFRRDGDDEIYVSSEAPGAGFCGFWETGDFYGALRFKTARAAYDFAGGHAVLADWHVGKRL